MAMAIQTTMPQAATEADRLATGLMELLQGQAEGWELSNYDIRALPYEEGVSVQMLWFDDQDIGRFIGLEVGTSQEVPVFHVTVGAATAYFNNEKGLNIWRQSHYEHGGFATSPLMALTLVNHLYNLASSWTRQEIEASQQLAFSC